MHDTAESALAAAKLEHISKRPGGRFEKSALLFFQVERSSQNSRREF
jgi:hypothetical protein